MARFHSLTIYTLARENLRDIARLTGSMYGVGDLVSPMRRAAISIVSVFCVGTSSGNDRQVASDLSIARASANELQGQLAIVADLGQLHPDHPIRGRCDHLERALTTLLRTLSG